MALYYCPMLAAFNLVFNFGAILAFLFIFYSDKRESPFELYICISKLFAARLSRGLWQCDAHALCVEWVMWCSLYQREPVPFGLIFYCLFQYVGAYTCLPALTFVNVIAFLSDSCCFLLFVGSWS